MVRASQHSKTSAPAAHSLVEWIERGGGMQRFTQHSSPAGDVLRGLEGLRPPAPVVGGLGAIPYVAVDAGPLVVGSTYLGITPAWRALPAFRASAFYVSMAQWHRVMHCALPAALERYSEYPMLATYAEAEAFCSTLSRTSFFSTCVPTEDQLERLARGPVVNVTALQRQDDLSKRALSQLLRSQFFITGVSSWLLENFATDLRIGAEILFPRRSRKGERAWHADDECWSAVWEHIMAPDTQVFAWRTHASITPLPAAERLEYPCKYGSHIYVQNPSGVYGGSYEWSAEKTLRCIAGHVNAGDVRTPAPKARYPFRLVSNQP